MRIGTAQFVGNVEKFLKIIYKLKSLIVEPTFCPASSLGQEYGNSPTANRLSSRGSSVLVTHSICNAFFILKEYSAEVSEDEELVEKKSSDETQENIKDYQEQHFQKELVDLKLKVRMITVFHNHKSTWGSFKFSQECKIVNMIQVNKHIIAMA